MVPATREALSGRSLVLGRRGAALAVAALTAVALALRLAHLRYGLPFPFHSDAFQVEQAAALLRQGWFTDAYDYPHGLLYVYAALARLAGLAPERFADPAVHQALGRAVSAVAGALLVPGVYRLARVAFERRVALLAAAAIALDTAHVLTAHQARPHEPVLASIVLLAPSVLRLATRPSARASHAAATGAALGLAASLFPLGTLASGWAAALVVALVRPFRRGAALAGALLLGFLVVWAGLGVAMDRSDVARPLPGSSAFDSQSTLSLPLRMARRLDPGDLPTTAVNWIASSPALFAAAGLFVLLRAVGRGAPAAGPRRALLLYGSFPLVVYLTMGLFLGTHARYALAATPFLAVLAAAGCLALPRGARAVAAALLLLVPLAGTALYLRLLTRVDTRLSAALMLPWLEAAGATVAVQDRILVDRAALGPAVLEFPPHGSLASSGDFAPRLALRDSGADLYLRATGSQWSRGPLSPDDLAALGFRLHGVLRGGRASTFDLPDLPDRLASQLVRASRPGPTIELWTTAEGERALQSIAPAASDEDWTGAENPEDAVAEVLAARGGAALGGATGGAGAAGRPPAIVSLDVDGDGAPEQVASSVDAAQLARLLALPSGDWSDAGGGRAGDRPAPRLTVRGRPLNGEPVLLLLSGAPPGGAVRWSVRVQTSADAAAIELPMPETVAGPRGDVALGALWPREAPGGTTVSVQAFVADAGAPQGIAASNAMAATSPR